MHFAQMSQGDPDPALSDLLRLHYVLRGLACTQPWHARPSRLPITMEMLHILRDVLSIPPVDYDAVMLWAACKLGFFGFHWSGEFTSSHGWMCPLTPSNIRVDSHLNPSFVAITLCSSKTEFEPFCTGVTLYIGRTGSQVCPVTTVMSYLATCPPSPGPLFIYCNGTPLTHSALVGAVRQTLSCACLQVDAFNSHSFRISAAT